MILFLSSLLSFSHLCCFHSFCSLVIYFVFSSFQIFSVSLFVLFAFLPLFPFTYVYWRIIIPFDTIATVLHLNDDHPPFQFISGCLGGFMFLSSRKILLVCTALLSSVVSCFVVQIIFFNSSSYI